jgi:hypothetical protein
VSDIAYWIMAGIIFGASFGLVGALGRGLGDDLIAYLRRRRGDSAYDRRVAERLRQLRTEERPATRTGERE